MDKSRCYWLLVGVMVLLQVSCGHFRGKGGGGSAAGVAEVVEASGRADYQGQLRSLVKDYLEATARDQEELKDKVIVRKPYFFREYAVYPDSAGKFDVVFQETESRSAPYAANVRLNKLRFATQLHRKREEARKDFNFLRDTGVETLSYEFRNGRWTRIGSLFVATKSEENVNGEWVPLKEHVERTVAAEEPQGGWFNRMWSKVTNR